MSKFAQEDSMPKTLNVKKLLTGITILLLASGLFFIVSAADENKIPITTSSDQARQSYLKGRDLADRLQARESLPYFQKAVAEDPNFAVAYLNLAGSAQNAKDFFANVNKAVALKDKVSEGERLWILGQEAGSNGFPLKQKDYYQKLVAQYPNDERAHNLLATVNFGLQDYKAAVQGYENAIRINPQYSPAYNLLGYAYRFLEQYDKSEQAFKKYIDLIPNDPNPYDSYAELLLKIGRYDDSITNYRKALQADRNFVASYVGIASNLDAKGDYESARKELQTLLNNAGNDGERRTAHFSMSVSYAAAGDLEKAIAEQEQMYQIAAKSNDSANMSGDLVTVGNLLLELGRVDEAQKKFEQAAKIIVDSNLSADVKRNAKEGLLFNTAEAKLKKGDFAAAKTAAAEFKKEVGGGDNPFQVRLAHEIEGRIALEEKQFDKAITELKQSNLQNPYNLYRLARAYEGKGDTANAATFYKKAANNNTIANLNLALIRSKAKKAAGI
jgi:tetratricopeptide (TPR) repeat protein